MVKSKNTLRKPKPFRIPKEQAKLELLLLREEMLQQMALEELATLMSQVSDHGLFLFHRSPCEQALELLTTVRAQRMGLQQRLDGKNEKQHGA